MQFLYKSFYELINWTNLKNCKVGFPSQGHFFSVGWVGVVAVFIEPLLEDLDGLLGKVAPPFAAGLGRPDRAALRVALIRGVLVGGRTRVPPLVICGRNKNTKELHNALLSRLKKTCAKTKVLYICGFISDAKIFIAPTFYKPTFYYISMYCLTCKFMNIYITFIVLLWRHGKPLMICLKKWSFCDCKSSRNYCYGVKKRQIERGMSLPIGLKAEIFHIWWKSVGLYLGFMCLVSDILDDESLSEI